MYCLRQGDLEAATVITSSESDPYERSFVTRQIFQHKAVSSTNYEPMNLMQGQSPGCHNIDDGTNLGIFPRAEYCLEACEQGRWLFCLFEESSYFEHKCIALSKCDFNPDSVSVTNNFGWTVYKDSLQFTEYQFTNYNISDQGTIKFSSGTHDVDQHVGTSF